MTVCAAPYGGPMAIVRDSQQFTKVTGSAKPIIRIFTASGNLISSITVSVINCKVFYKGVISELVLCGSGIVGLC